jgi:hypothetical protein
VASFYTLIHAASDEVRASRLEPSAASEVLRATLRDLFLSPSTQQGTRRATPFGSGAPRVMSRRPGMRRDTWSCALWDPLMPRRRPTPP